MNAFDIRVQQHRQLDAKIDEIEKEFKERLLPFKAAREKLRTLLSKMLEDSGQESAKTAQGTVYRLIKTSVTLADPEVFRRHVIGSENWDLIDWRANKTAVMDFVSINSGELPPGVKVTQMAEIGVRAPAVARKRKPDVVEITQDDGEQYDAAPPDYEYSDEEREGIPSIAAE